MVDGGHAERRLGLQDKNVSKQNILSPFIELGRRAVRGGKKFIITQVGLTIKAFIDRMITT